MVKQEFSLVFGKKMVREEKEMLKKQGRIRSSPDVLAKFCYRPSRW